jgi:hypothetical protein
MSLRERLSSVRASILFWRLHREPEEEDTCEEVFGKPPLQGLKFHLLEYDE